jgi:ABC-type sulfate transport system substrate-binding protein
MRCQHVQVTQVVAIRKETWLAVNPALNNMQRHTGQQQTRQTGHGGTSIEAKAPP